MRNITDAGTYSHKGVRVPIAYRGRSDQHNAGRHANVNRYNDINQGNGMEDLYAIMEKYRIKGFEFGNWVTQEERAEYVASLTPTLEDLYSVVGSRNLGFDRNVGIAFGARGVRGARAHYEPVLNMINLTREHGAGSLAHEYGHAIDYNMGGFVDQHKTYTALSGGHSTAAPLEDNVGGQLRALVNQIVDSIRNGKNFAKIEEINREEMKRSGKVVYSDYYFRRTEIFARFFEQYVCYCLYQRGISSRLLAKTWSVYMSNYAYVEKDDFMKIKPVADKLMKKLVEFMNSNSTIRRAKSAPYPKPVIAKPKPAPIKKEDPKPEPKPVGKAAATKLSAKQRRAKENAERLEAERKRKEAHKALIKKDPEWIKKFASKVGVSESMINAMYRVCETWDLRPVMCGIYCDPDGHIVATDAHILIAVKAKIPAAMKGKIFAPSGKTIDGKYPSYKGILVSEGKKKYDSGHIKVERTYKVVENKPSERKKNSRNVLVLSIGKTNLVASLYDKVMRIFSLAKEKPTCLQTDADALAVGFVSKSIDSVIMPILGD